jgi:hypothetical protein
MFMVCKQAAKLQLSFSVKTTFIGSSFAVAEISTEVRRTYSAATYESKSHAREFDFRADTISD